MAGRFFYMLTGVLLALVLVSYLFSDIVIYFIIALVLSTILKPAVNLLNHLELYGNRIPRWVAVSTTIVGLIVLLFYGIFSLAPILVEQANGISKADVTAMVNKISKPVTEIENALNQGGIIKIKPGYFRRYLKEFITFDVKKGDVAHYVSSVINITSSIFVGMLAVGFMTFFFLLERGLVKRTILEFVPNAFFELTVNAFYKIEKLLTSYLLGLATQVTAIFVLSVIGYYLLGMQYIAAVALFAALINVIPYIGPLVGNLTAVVVGIVTTPGITEADYLSFGLQIFSVGLIVQFIDNIALQPLIFSRNMKAHPLEIFVAIFAGSALGGIVGMVTAIPVYTMLRVTVTELVTGYRAYKVFRVRNLSSYSEAYTK